MILAIESSCDDSSVALINIDNLDLIKHQKISQEKEHCKFGGVVPELAARLHTESLPKILENFKDYFKNIKAIAVTNEPGLSVSLITGLCMAKTISLALNLPLILVNHLIGHIYSLFLKSPIKLPIGILLVSGGHTLILDIDKYGKINKILQTSDDSFGESFDKVAKMLGFGYPGGVVIQNLALKSKNHNKFNFTLPIPNKNRLEYSFSGLKNQARIHIENLNLSEDDKNDIAYSFEKTACDHILNKLNLVFKKYQFRDFGIVGGASANLRLRRGINELGEKYNINLLYAPFEFCSDNAVMIARAARDKFLKNKFNETIHTKPKTNIDNTNIYD